ncbi:MAG TPA: hypothetical protein VFP31_12140 [Gaiellaceae bacterium]|nr:hypothetical protein [Gaiellaceae bacterium]
MRAAVVAACALVALTAGVGDARATNECRGLMVCVPVAGPWVVVPTTRHAEFQLACPRRYIVGGLDAELSDRSIDISFPGLLGSPVNPGVTTTSSAVFAGHYTGVARRATSFRPHIGCIPSSGGGGTPPLAIWLSASAFPPGRPVVRRVRNVVAIAGRTTRGAQGCARNERLVGATHSVGIYTQGAPSGSLLSAVSATRTVASGRVRVVVRTSAALRGTRAVVQVQALCAGAGR